MIRNLDILNAMKMTMNKSTFSAPVVSLNVWEGFEETDNPYKLLPQYFRVIHKGDSLGGIAEQNTIIMGVRPDR